MNRNQIICAGTGLVVLEGIRVLEGITYQDQSFWFILFPLAIVVGLVTRHLGGAKRS